MRAFVIIVAALIIGTVSAPLPITAEAICFIGVDVMCAHVCLEVALLSASVTTSYPITRERLLSRVRACVFLEDALLIGTVSAPLPITAVALSFIVIIDVVIVIVIVIVIDVVIVIVIITFPLSRFPLSLLTSRRLRALLRFDVTPRHDN